MSDTVEQLQAELAAAGRRPEAVQRADRATAVPDGVYLVGDHDGRVRVELVERGQRTHPEDFEDEASAVHTLARRLLRPPTGRPRTAEETAASVSRMQAKAQAVRERLGHKPDGA